MVMIVTLLCNACLWIITVVSAPQHTTLLRRPSPNTEYWVMAVMSSLYEVHFSVFVLSCWLYSSHVLLVWSRLYADTSSSTTSLEIFASHAWMLPGLFCDPVMFVGQETTIHSAIKLLWSSSIKRFFFKEHWLFIIHVDSCRISIKQAGLSDTKWCHALVQKLYLLIRDLAVLFVCLLSIDYISPCSWQLSVRLFITVLPHLEFISFFFPYLLWS